MHIPSRSISILFLFTAATVAQQQVIIQRDINGVPHVFAQSDRGAFYGLGYATAEHRLFQMCWARLRYQGRSAKYLGAGDDNENKIADKSARVLGWARLADKVVQALSPEDLQLLQHYADGVNAYVAATTYPQHPLFACYGIPVDPWLPRDCIGVYYELADAFQGLDDGEVEVRVKVDAGKSFAQIAQEHFGNSMCDDSAASVQQSDVLASVQAQMQSFATLKGIRDERHCPLGKYVPAFSEAFAVAGFRTTTGRSVLGGMPRIGLRYPNTF